MVDRFLITVSYLGFAWSCLGLFAMLSSGHSPYWWVFNIALFAYNVAICNGNIELSRRIEAVQA